jgi:hypothetical protein
MRYPDNQTGIVNDPKSMLYELYSKGSAMIPPNQKWSPENEETFLQI